MRWLELKRMRTWFCLPLLLLTLPASVLAGLASAAGFDWPPAGAPVARIDVRVVEQHPDGFDWPGLARALIGFKQGEVITRRQVDQARSRMEPFARVEITTTPDDAGVDLLFTVTPYKRIKSITLDGSYPLFDREVRNVMSVAPGDVFQEQAAQAQKELIARRYRAEGYSEPRVVIRTRRDTDDGHYHLHVIIEKGPYFRIGSIRLSGNQAFADPVLLAQMKLWRKATFFLRTGRFVEQDLVQDIKNLTTFYRRRGFADVRIDHLVERDKDALRVSVVLRIREGPRYSLSFLGNQAFSEEALRTDAALVENGAQGNIGLQRFVQNIRRRYLQAGYADVKVRWVEDAAPEERNGVRRIRIEVEEGPRLQVKSVRIQGHKALDAKTLQDQMLTRPARGLANGDYVAAVLQEDLASMRALYLRKGFLNPVIVEEVKIDPQTNAVDITVDIDEGFQTLVESISIDGDTPVPMQQLMPALQLKAGQAYQPYLVERDKNEIALQIAPLGYPYVQVSSRVSLSPDSRQARIAFQVAAGPRVQIGRIFFSGNFRTKQAILERSFGLRQGETFSLSCVLDAQRRLRNLQVFEAVQVRTIGLKEQARQVHLLVETVEKKPYYFELGGGFQTNKGPYLRTKIGDHNFAGRNMDIRTGGEISEVGYRWEAGIGDPRFLGTTIRSDLGVYVEREELFNQDFGTDSRGGTLTFSRRWGPRISTDLTWRYEQRVQFLRDDADVAETDTETLEDRRILVVTPSIGYDSRDSFIRPRRGVLAGLSMDISRGLDNTLDNFIRYRLDLRGYHNFHPRLTLAARLGLGYMYEYGVEGQIPEDQLFFLGGTTDVRGFGENLLRFDDQGDPVGGRLAVNAGLEARIDLGRNFELALFVDSGSIQEAAEGAGGDDDFHHAAGLGLHYLTPVGPIGLMYGYKLDRREGESSGQVHFAIGYTF